MFYRLLTRLAGQILLVLAAFVWGTIAFFDPSLGGLRVGFAVAALLAVAGLVGLHRGWRWTSVVGAVTLFVPIGLLAHHNGASPWAWLFWLFCIIGTERWLRDAVQAEDATEGKGPADTGRPGN